MFSRSSRRSIRCHRSSPIILLLLGTTGFAYDAARAQEPNAGPPAEGRSAPNGSLRPTELDKQHAVDAPHQQLVDHHPLDVLQHPLDELIESGELRPDSIPSAEQFAAHLRPAYPQSLDETYVPRSPDQLEQESQLIYLDFDGASDVTYNGRIVLKDIEVPPFSAAAAGLEGQEDQISTSILARLQRIFDEHDVTFRLDQPAVGTEFSTVFIGGTGQQFQEVGDYLALAEHVDYGNIDPSDNAFVFSDLLVPGHSANEPLARHLAEHIARVALLLLGDPPPDNRDDDDPGTRRDTFWQDYGWNQWQNVYVPAGTHTFGIDGIFFHAYTWWYVNLGWQEEDESAWWNGYADPTFSWYFSSGSTDIEGDVFNADPWGFLEWHGWTVTVVQPDLVVNDIWTSPSSPNEGESCTIYAELCNTGGADTAWGVDLHYYVDGSYAGSDTLSLGLDAFECNTESLSYTFPSCGWREICVVIDPYDEVDESNEYNNERCEDIYVTCLDPDLIVNDIWTSPDPPIQNQACTIYTQLCNTGNGDADGSIGLDYYVDGSYIGSDTLSNGLDAGDCNNESIGYTFQSSGYHQICVTIDPDDDVDESNENNNQRCENQYVPSPDLIVASVTEVESSYDVGDDISARACIQNIGDGSAGSTDLMYYLGTPSNHTYHELQPGGVGALGPGDSEEDIIWPSEPIPLWVPEGTYQVWVFADSSYEEDESNEDNNWGSSASFTIHVPLADLVVLDILMENQTDLPDVYRDDDVQLDFLVKNQGDAGTSRDVHMAWWWGTYEGSMEPEGYIDDGSLGWVNGLGPGEEEWETDASWIIPDVSPGTYWLTAKIDWDELVDESNEDNNVRSESFVVLEDPHADLYPSGPWYEIYNSAEPAASWGWSVVVTNAADADALTGPWSMEWVVSTNDVAGDGDDFVIGTWENRNDDFAPGQSRTYEYDRDVPIVIDAGYYYFCVRLYNVESEVNTSNNTTCHADTIWIQWVDEDPFEDEWLEDNDSWLTATDLNYHNGGPLVGSVSWNNLTIDAEYDDDWHVFSCAGGGAVTVTVDDFVNSEGDLDVCIYSAPPQPIDCSMSSGDIESVTFDVVAGNSYYIEIYGYGGDICFGSDFDGYRLLINTPVAGPSEITQLDQWWAYAGGGPIVVTLSVNIGALTRYELDVTIEDGNAWDLSANAYAMVDGAGYYEFTDLTGVADLGVLAVGNHTIAVHSFVPPAEPEVERVTFELRGDSQPHDAVFKAMFVADRPALTDTEVLGIAFLDGYGNSVSGVSSVQTLLNAYAPVFYFDNGEDYFPESVATTLDLAGCGQRVTVKDADGGVLAEWPLDATTLFELAAHYGSGEDGESMWIDLPCTSPADLGGAGDDTFQIYGTATIQEDWIALSYWIHYAYSSWQHEGGFNNHEGDWEGGVVYLQRQGGDSTFMPTRVAYSQHEMIVGTPGLEDRNRDFQIDGGQRAEWATLQASGYVEDALRPHLYVGLGGHASYFAPGCSAYWLPYPYPWSSYYEYHEGLLAGGPVQSAQVAVIPRVPEASTGAAWLLFPGHWGQATLDELPFGNNGPLGPAYGKPPLFGGGQDRGCRWLDPVGWPTRGIDNFDWWEPPPGWPLDVEVGSAIFRDGVFTGLVWHAAILWFYDGYSGGYRVIQANGYDATLGPVSWDEFLDGCNQFEGAREHVGYSPPAAWRREEAIYWARYQFNAAYPSDVPPSPIGIPNSSCQEGDGVFRCDQLVEYVYSTAFGSELNPGDDLQPESVYNGENAVPVQVQLPNVATVNQTLPGDLDTSLVVGFSELMSRGTLAPGFGDSMTLVGDMHGAYDITLSFESDPLYVPDPDPDPPCAADKLFEDENGVRHDCHRALVTPHTPFSPGETITLTISTAARDLGGNPLSAPYEYVYTFSELSAPTGVTASDGTYCDRVVIDWNEVPAADDYTIWRSTSDDAYAADEIGFDDMPPYDDWSAEPGVPYYYWVRARAGSTSSPFSESDDGLLASVPPAPEGVSATDSVHCFQISVSWGAVPEVDEYEVWRHTLNDPDSAELRGTALNSPFVDDVPIVGPTYWYWVRAVNVCGPSEFSSPDTGFPASVPTQPENVSPANGATCQPTSVCLAWQEVPDADAYDVYWGTTDPPSYWDTVAASPACPTHTDGVTHYWFVEAHNVCGTGSPSAVWSYTVYTRVLDYIVIEGPDTVNENSTQDYDCRAYYMDGTDPLVEPDSWSEDSPYATISETGLLTTYDVTGNQNCQITATYTECGIAVDDTLNVTIVDEPESVLLSGHILTWAGAPLGSVALSRSDGGDGCTSDAQGYYECTVPHGWTGVITPCKDGWLFDPPSTSYDGVTEPQENQNYAGTLIYDIDPPDCGDDFVGPGDFSRFVPCWQHAVPPADERCDFDCTGFIDEGDFSFFQPAWLKSVFDPSIPFPPCRLCDRGGGSRGSDATIDVSLVATRSPSVNDVTEELPRSLRSSAIGRDYWLEVWVRDVSENPTGVTSAYMDVSIPVDVAEVLAIAHSECYNVFESGSASTILIDEFGGSSLNCGSISEMWVRVAMVRVRTASPGIAEYGLQPADLRFAASGRGIVPWNSVEAVGVTMEHFAVNSEPVGQPLDEAEDKPQP